jgi:hypothetical protein
MKHLPALALLCLLALASSAFAGANPPAASPLVSPAVPAVLPAWMAASNLGMQGCYGNCTLTCDSGNTYYLYTTDYACCRSVCPDGSNVNGGDWFPAYPGCGPTHGAHDCPGL